MNKALFLDRDGVINHDYDYVHKLEDFHFIDGIFDLCKYFYDSGFLIFIVTNQSGISRGFYSEDDLIKLNKWISDKFLEQNIKIEKIYYSTSLDENDYYRKPNPGMIFQVAKEFDIDLKSSILIGDKMRDINSGLRAGVLSCFLYKGKCFDKTYHTVQSFSEIINIYNKR